MPNVSRTSLSARQSETLSQPPAIDPATLEAATLARFGELDLNGDGRLTVDELRRVVQGGPYAPELSTLALQLLKTTAPQLAACVQNGLTRLALRIQLNQVAQLTGIGLWQSAMATSTAASTQSTQAMMQSDEQVRTPSDFERDEEAQSALRADERARLERHSMETEADRQRLLTQSLTTVHDLPVDGAISSQIQ